MRRPSLPRPWRWHRNRSVATPATPVAPKPRASVHEDDLRLIRRTRLRLMLVSGVVTLLILIALEGATYATVANRVENAGMDQLNRTAGIKVAPGDDAYGYAVVGPRSGVIALFVDPTGSVVPYAHYMPKIQSGLPVKASLDAVAEPGDLDTREVTLPDGTPCRVMSYFSADPRFANYKVQLIQDRSGEVSLLDILGKVLLGGGLIALLAALLGGYLYAGRALIPIRDSIDRRQAALQRQREFAANASHELRTPITVISASVEDLKRNRRSRVEDVGEALGDIDAETRHMTALVEDMLLLARTDSDVVQIERVPLDLGDIAADASSSLTMLGHETGVAVLLDPMPTPVLGDALRLRQLVTILVDNAIRHSRAGSTVETRVRPEDGGAVLQVDDHGPGIKTEDLLRIFERFWRADDAPAGGTGLGLAIAKWIVEQHGGKISAENLPDGGARFRVWLPGLASAAADWAHDEVVEADWRAPRPPEAPEAPEAPDAPEPQAP